jgi:hypothetical protein
VNSAAINMGVQGEMNIENINPKLLIIIEKFIYKIYNTEDMYRSFMFYL